MERSPDLQESLIMGYAASCSGIPMSENSELRKSRILGEFAEKFLMAVGYSADEISGLVDLSRVDSAKIKELLHAKTEEARKIEDAVKNPPRIHRFDEPLDD